ncbi:MAG TPA: hypothetical protein VM513_13315 [Kofleriaceae bacterium]|jgi:hypothetical protein|nr:hypothetical protein [Kofleriaceae bacterium]
MHSIACMEGKRLQRSTESYGLGQSGYTAGRAFEDPALNLVARNISYPRGTDDHVLATGDDERWIGAGGARWVPAEDSGDADETTGEHATVESPTADPH